MSAPVVRRLLDGLTKKGATEAARDLTSDMWSQKGHIWCARALKAAGCTPFYTLQRWPGRDKPVDNRAAFEMLLMSSSEPEMPSVRRLLQEAPFRFRTALSCQARWRPAVTNRNEIDAILSEL
jgi:hypothetical protein